MKLTKKKLKELRLKGKEAGLFDELSMEQIDELKLPYIKQGVKVIFPDDIDSNVIKSSIENIKVTSPVYSLIFMERGPESWVGEVDSIKVLDDGSVICNLVVLDKQLAIMFEEKESVFKIEPVLKFKGSKTKYFDFDSFLLSKNESVEVIEDEQPVVAEEYVLKVDLDNVLADFEVLKEESLKAMDTFETKIINLNKTIATKSKEISTLSEKLSLVKKELSDKNYVLKSKDDSIAMFQKRMKDAEQKVATFENKLKTELESKRIAKFNNIFKNYCSAHNIADNEIEIKRKELSSLSEDALEIINKDSLRLIGNFNGTEEIIENSQNVVKTVVVSNKSNSEKSISEKNNEWFERLQQINNN